MSSYTAVLFVCSHYCYRIFIVTPFHSWTGVHNDVHSLTPSLGEPSVPSLDAHFTVHTTLYFCFRIVTKPPAISLQHGSG